MKPEDLVSLERARAQPDAFEFHRFFFDGLMQQGWAVQALTIKETHYELLSNLLVDWIKQAALENPSDEMRLLAARNGLRRLALSMGSSLAVLLARALNLSEGTLLQNIPFIDRHKLALLADAELSANFDLLRWSEEEPRLAMLFAINALDDSAANPSRLALLNKLTYLIPELPLADLPPSLLNLLFRVCFKLSYLTSEVRYTAKKRLVEQAQHILRQHQMEPVENRIKPASRKERPHLLIIGEGLIPGHAMYRFFAEPLKEFRQHFDITLMTEAKERVAEQEFIADKVIFLDQHPRPVEHWAELVLQQTPDIIFYPSIGMSYATFTLSLMRLAPLQVASTGHPAPSCSPTIDATLLFNELHAPAAFPHPLLYNNHQLTTALPNWTISTRPDRAKNTIPCIGVIASGMKLNASFLDVIEEVMLKYEQPCRLVFFPYVEGLELQGLSRQLKTQFPHAQVQPSVDHISYMDQLAECDLVLQSFPFGGANTTTDALDLGIPVVGLRGMNLSGQTDPLLLAGRGLGELCVNNTEDYINLALRLLRDSDYVEEIKRRLQQASPTAGMQKIGNLTAAKVLLEFWNASLH